MENKVDMNPGTRLVKLTNSSLEEFENSECVLEEAANLVEKHQPQFFAKYKILDVLSPKDGGSVCVSRNSEGDEVYSREDSSVSSDGLKEMENFSTLSLDYSQHADTYISRNSLSDRLQSREAEQALFTFGGLQFLDIIKHNKRIQDTHSFISYLWGMSEVVLFYFIPIFNRIGKKNKIWQICEIFYKNFDEDDSAEHSKTMDLLMDDWITSDRIFFVTFAFDRIPKSIRFSEKYGQDWDNRQGLNYKISKEAFYQLSGVGTPQNVETDGFPSNICKNTLKSHSLVIRDGEVTYTDTALGYGISLHFEELLSISCRKAHISYLNELNGSITQLPFHPCSGSVYIPLQRSLSFTLSFNDREFKTPSGFFRIPFPGDYQIFLCNEGEGIKWLPRTLP